MSGRELEQILVPIFGILFTIGLPLLLVFWIIYTKHREKMRLIEKGFTPEEARKFFSESEKKPRNPYGALKWGILFLFLGAGIFTANVLQELYDFNDGVTFGLIMLSIGLGFVVYYLLVRGKIHDNTSNKQNSINN